MTKARILTIIVSTVIILPLAWIVIPERNVIGAHITSVKTQISTFSTALDVLFIDIGRYPSTSEGFQPLFECPASVKKEHWQGPYLRNELPHDPWGHAYRYIATPEQPQPHGVDYEIISAGKDGIFGTKDDLTNYQHENPHEYYKGTFFDHLRWKIDFFRYYGRTF